MKHMLIFVSVIAFWNGVAYPLSSCLILSSIPALGRNLYSSIWSCKAKHSVISKVLQIWNSSIEISQNTHMTMLKVLKYTDGLGLKRILTLYCFIYLQIERKAFLIIIELTYTVLTFMALSPILVLATHSQIF